MGQQIGLGSLAGLVVGALCWRGNQSASTVSTFPDLVTLAALVISLSVATRYVLGRSRFHSRAAALRAGVTVAAAAGVVFGAVVVTIGVLRFSHPGPVLLAFGFFTAFGSALACGVITSLVTTYPRRRAA